MSIIFFLCVLSILYVLFSLSCQIRLRYFSPEVVVRCLPKWPAWKVSMVVFVRKLNVVHKQVGGCLISYHLQLACLRTVMFWWRTERVWNVNKAEIHLYICKSSKIPWQEKLEIGNELFKEVETKFFDRNWYFFSRPNSPKPSKMAKVLKEEKFRNRNVNLWGPLSWTKYTPNQSKNRPEKPILATRKYFFASIVGKS